MKMKRTKLRLRKQVLISFPIAIFVSLLAVIYIISQNTALAQEVKKENTLSISRILDAKKYTQFSIRF